VTQNYSHVEWDYATEREREEREGRYTSLARSKSEVHVVRS